MEQLPQWAYNAALASLPLQTPLRLRRLIGLGDAGHVWEMLSNNERPLDGIPDDVWRAWHSCGEAHAQAATEQCITAGVSVVSVHDQGYPDVLLSDPEAPAVLFFRGNSAVLGSRRVGIVGTRNATQRGKYFARELGAALAAEGVCVISGLARGIDVESHVGALSQQNGCGPVAVVASGPDVVYPREHHRVWAQIARNGCLLSEAPPGTVPEPFRFPMRNRIIAGLSEVLVVVESQSKGGSMITVREAMKRDVMVMAVPGSPGVPASEGTNDLLRDGCAPVTEVVDVLLALGLHHRNGSVVSLERDAAVDDEREVLRAMGRDSCSVDEVALRASLPVVHAAVLLGRLEAKGWVANSGGWWETLIV